MRDLSKIAGALERSMLDRLSSWEALGLPKPAPVKNCTFNWGCSCGCDYDYLDLDEIDDEPFEDLDLVVDLGDPDEWDDEWGEDLDNSHRHRQENVLLERHDFSWWIPRSALENWGEESNLAAIIEPSLLGHDLSTPSADRRVLLHRVAGRVTLDIYSLDVEELPRTSLVNSRNRLANNPYSVDGELEVHFTNVYPDHSYVGRLFGYNLSDPQKQSKMSSLPAGTPRERRMAQDLEELREVPWPRKVEDVDRVWVTREALTTWGTGFYLNYHLTYVTEAHPDYPVRLFRQDEDSPWMFAPSDDRKLRRWLAHRQSEVDPCDRPLISIQSVRS